MANASGGQARALFHRHFGDEPLVVASAPGRVNLIGEHIDYNGGAVLPIAIAQRTTVAVAPARARGRSTVVSSARSEAGVFETRSPRRTGAWWDYVAGVVHELARMGVAVPDVDVAIHGDVPLGAGLSSSAALEVASTMALLALAQHELPPRDVALLGVRVEGEFVGVATGIMDQCASALARAGHALHLECDTTASELVPMTDAVLIFDTGVARALRDSAFNARRAECEAALARLRRIDPGLSHLAAATPEMVRDADLPSPLDRRARHVVSETERVRSTVAALRRTGTLPGELLCASHESLRADYECSCPELDWFATHAMRHEGVTGARLTGAGWGGCAIAVGAEDALGAAAPLLARAYEERFGRSSRVWLTRAAAGARIETR
ncbi:MAG TPA: galactokinase [Gemmatimonadaceae bacterium]